ncbi:hypothetical protein GGR53DRAFT_516313 [Hypoxylon sp. FL1150]|nr:hypothetical protein GGR53DRAFT_516313 [Hypoxylon sp. FL1150]
MASFHTQYKPLLDFYPERSVVPVFTTDDELKELDSRRTRFVEKPTVGVRHPGYPAYANPLLSFPAVDHDGVDYDLAIHACYLLVGNAWPRDGSPSHEAPYLSYSDRPRESAPESVITPPATGDTVIRRTSYLHVPSYTGRGPYPITPSFDHWEFPHAFDAPPAPSDSGGNGPLVPPPETPPRPFLPAAWRAAAIAAAPSPSDLTGRLGILARDQTCRVTQYGMGVEAAHLVPKKAQPWFTLNSMKWYAKTPDDVNAIDDMNNLLLLRADIHYMLDCRELIIVPKKLEDRYVFVLKVIKSKKRYLYDAYEIYHNRICQDFLGVRIEYLFARFAWSIFHPETLPIVLTPNFKYPVRVYDATAKSYQVQDRLMSEFRKERSLSTGGSNKRPRSSGLVDYDAYSAYSDNTLASSEFGDSDEDSYEERLCSMDIYNERLSGEGEEHRGRKRSRKKS